MTSDACGYKVVMSYFQIYNETIKDLLLKQQLNHIEILEDPKTGTVVSGLAQVIIRSADEVMDLIRIGMGNRVTEANGTN